MKLKSRYLDVNILMKVCVLGGFAIAMIGCGGESKLATAPAVAVVRMDGEPFGPCTLMLYPADPGNKNSRSVTGTVDESGNVVFTTYAVGDGLPPGEYKVAVRPALSAAPPKPIPPKYGDETKSPLRMTVAEGSPNEAAFDLESEAARKQNTLPVNEAYESPEFKAGT